MRVLVLYAHPVETSFNAALHRTTVEALRAAGHEVDDLDLYAEDFDPRLSRAERLDYHDTALNLVRVGPYAERLRSAEAVVFVFPTWCFGLPAILKGFFDRVMVPGVSFAIAGGRVTPLLGHIRRIAAVVTYGRPWWMVKFGIGDLPRAQIVRYFRWFCARDARVRYLGFYHMNTATAARRQRFLDRVAAAMRSLA